jgi:hypothetical protein
MRVTDVFEADGEVTIEVETTKPRAQCRGCGCLAKSQDRMWLDLRDLECCGRPTRLPRRLLSDLAPTTTTGPRQGLRWIQFGLEHLTGSSDTMSGRRRVLRWMFGFRWPDPQFDAA